MIQPPQQMPRFGQPQSEEQQRAAAQAQQQAAIQAAQQRMASDIYSRLASERITHTARGERVDAAHLRQLAVEAQTAAQGYFQQFQQEPTNGQT